MSDRVMMTVTEGIAHVRLNRPEKLNALDMEMFEQLIATGMWLKADPRVRAVVLSGNGRAFSAGLDFASFMGGSELERLLERGEDSPANMAQRVAWIWRELPVPVIAAVHGHCYGGGLQIAMGADMRCVAPDARLAIMEIKWGIIPDMGITRTILSVVREDVVRELTYTGRIFSGQEAQNLGFATRVSETPLEDALELAKAIAAQSPDAIRAAKTLFNRAPDQDEADALKLETTLQQPLLGSANQLEAVMANMQKRPAVFQDPE